MNITYGDRNARLGCETHRKLGDSCLLSRKNISLDHLRPDRVVVNSSPGDLEMRLFSSQGCPKRKYGRGTLISTTHDFSRWTPLESNMQAGRDTPCVHRVAFHGERSGSCAEKRPKRVAVAVAVITVDSVAVNTVVALWMLLLSTRLATRTSSVGHAWLRKRQCLVTSLKLLRTLSLLHR